MQYHVCHEILTNYIDVRILKIVAIYQFLAKKYFMHTTDNSMDISNQYKIIFFNKMFVGLNVHCALWSIMI